MPRHRHLMETINNDLLNLRLRKLGIDYEVRKAVSTELDRDKEWIEKVPEDVRKKLTREKAGGLARFDFTG